MESHFTPTKIRLNLISATCLLEEQKKSVLNFKAFCRTKNIPFGRLNYWLFVALPPPHAAATPCPIHVEFMLPGSISPRVPTDVDKACLVSFLQAAREATSDQNK